MYMSFASKTKTELCEIHLKRDCCKRAELCGILMFAANFDETRVRLISESAALAELTLKLLSELYHIEGNKYITEKKTGGENGVGCQSIKITVSAKHDIEKLREKLLNASTGLIPDDLFACELCRAAFLRGAFLSAGKLNDPSTSYRLEFSTGSAALADILISLLSQEDVLAKRSLRRGEYIVYVKSGDMIETFLAFIGSSNALFEVMNSRIVKSAVNDANRQTNCDTANLSRTVSASKSQLEAIRAIADAGKLDKLPDELKLTAKLRLDNPELSIKDLGNLFPEPISKSGVNHRLRKLVELSKEL